MAKHIRPKIVDWKRNNKIAIRNFHERLDFHDVVKLLIVRMLRRKNPDSSHCPIYTEFEREHDVPDIWIRLKNDVPTIYEIQRVWTKDWLDKANKRNEDNDFIPVAIKELEEKYKKFLNSLIKDLEKYII